MKIDINSCVLGYENLKESKLYENENGVAQDLIFKWTTITPVENPQQ